MRLSKHLNEATDDINVVAELLKKNCMPFLKETKGTKYWAWRGTKRPVIGGFSKFTPRTNRIPSDTPKKIHNYINRFLQKKFGWKARSEGVFATGNVEDASIYGDTYVMFPIGQYKYIWSPSITDMTSDFKELGFIDFGWDSGEWEVSDDSFEYNTEFSKLIDTYKNKDLKRALSSWNEIMFKCREYYLMDEDTFPVDEVMKLVWGKQ